MDYVLTFEKLISEDEKISGTKYDDNLKIGTLLKGIPQNLKQHVMVDIVEKPYQGPIPMELDRIQYRKGKGDQKGKGDKGKGGKGKGGKGRGKDTEEEKVAEDRKEKEEVLEEVSERKRRQEWWKECSAG